MSIKHTPESEAGRCAGHFYAGFRAGQIDGLKIALNHLKTHRRYIKADLAHPEHKAPYRATLEANLKFVTERIATLEARLNRMEAQ